MWFKFNSKIGRKRKQGLETSKETNQVELLTQRIITTQNDIDCIRKKRDQALSKIGNLLHESCPVAKDEVVIMFL